MRRMLALGWAGGSSFMDLEDDALLDGRSLGEAPLMAASKNSRSLRLRNICVGVLTVVKRSCFMGKGWAPLNAYTKVLGAKR